MPCMEVGEARHMRRDRLAETLGWGVKRHLGSPRPENGRALGRPLGSPKSDRNSNHRGMHREKFISQTPAVRSLRVRHLRRVIRRTRLAEPG